MTATAFEGRGAGSGVGPGAAWAWCLYDWANSAYPTVIVTFVFSAYFARGVAETPEFGTVLWGNAISLSALAVALLAPVLGAIADQGGRRKPWMAAFTATAVAASAALWWIEPRPELALLALLLIGLGNFGFEFGAAFYNAMLPDIAGPARIGRLSGWAWALGYAGGLGCLALALLLFVLPEAPLFGLERGAAEEVRATGPLVALWMALFSLPLFLFVPDRPRTALPLASAVKLGLATLLQTLRHLGRYPGLLRFLIARMIYTDGLNTLFAFGGLYAAGTFGMEFEEILVFGILLNVASGLGAFGFAWIDDWIGPKPTILIALAALAALGLAILLIEDKIWFTLAGCGIGLFLGPAQAASRSLMARLAPREYMTEMFGLYALSGKATAFVGPALVGWVTYLAGSQRLGMATILAFFLVGMVLLWPLKAPR
ncbi:MAG: MFS transporter [Kiloniellales bacterium]